MKLITLVLYCRADYTRQVLQALARCFGIDEYTVMIRIDPGFPDVHAAAVEFAQSNVAQAVDIAVRPRRFGCDGNTWATLAEGFKKADRLIHLEDDTVPRCRDFLRLMEWGLETYRNDERVSTISGCHLNRTAEDCDPALLCTMLRDENFVPWGWASWADRYKAYMDELGTLPQFPEPSWDIKFGWWGTLSGRHRIFPRLARIQNVGRDRGAHVALPEHAVMCVEYGAWTANPDGCVSYEPPTEVIPCRNKPPEWFPPVQPKWPRV